MKKIAFARQIVKRLTTAFQMPTKPASNDHTDGTWISTDLYNGEFCLNTASRELTIRTNGAGGDTIDYIDKISNFDVLSNIQATRLRAYTPITQTVDNTPTEISIGNYSSYKSVIGTARVIGYDVNQKYRTYSRSFDFAYNVVDDMLSVNSSVPNNNLLILTNAILISSAGALNVQVVGTTAIINWFVEYDLTIIL
jgi:hypothetical protein